ncbi:hypothetical protein PISMIDRAFT_680773 [Pisolithus microcarpus 441]|uniref:Fungal-type protein kinase domain-containing protein n=1 Tax=Pisolithus microcarpus 441 TaxID=765257 RepID=A0A0C9ZQP2_9AGAM|nr:hypothetical protein BKA83DRAFT_680773 [Pisolithus microcarpus]KIK22008.1 hypothetical protein PISMIDRAFT_680773 [Pisolithus microcarpus 441]
MTTYSGRHDRTGTWQFMSAALLRSPGRMHELKDDIESFVHVLGWIALSYLPSSMGGDERTHILSLMYDRSGKNAEGREEGGSYKAFQLALGVYPGEGFELTEHPPILELIQNLASPFRARYGKPPTEEDQKIFEFLMPQYRLNIERLGSPEWFLRTFEDALESPGWPAKDGARDRRIAFIDGTARQRQPPAPRIKAVPQPVPTSSGSLKRSATPPPPAPQEKRSDLDDNSDKGITRG